MKARIAIASGFSFGTALLDYGVPLEDEMDGTDTDRPRDLILVGLSRFDELAIGVDSLFDGLSPFGPDLDGQPGD
jgi:hypothetical protein